MTIDELMSVLLHAKTRLMRCRILITGSIEGEPWPEEQDLARALEACVAQEAIRNIDNQVLLDVNAIKKMLKKDVHDDGKAA
jgi:hypothetical protein